MSVDWNARNIESALAEYIERNCDGIDIEERPAALVAVMDKQHIPQPYINLDLLARWLSNLGYRKP